MDMSTPPLQKPAANQQIVFGLLRHGITLWNEEKRIQGSKNSPLSQQGRAATAVWARYLEHGRWDRIVASDLGRVKETVAILNTVLNLPLTFDARLRELDWGQWEGKKVQEIKTSAAAELDRQVKAGWNFRPPGGESRAEVLARAKAALLETARHRPGENILTVCHLGVIKCLVLDALGNSYLPSESIRLEQNTMHLLAVSGENLSCLQLNIAPPP